MPTRSFILITLLGLLAFPGLSAQAALAEIDDRDAQALQASATVAFHEYLEAVDDGPIGDAAELVLDPCDMEGRDEVYGRLEAFRRGREKNPVRNEACIVRTAGDWAMVVYQYDTTIAGKTARVITTAWMIQWEGLWRQFIVAPSDDHFWNERLSDYELLQKWFDEHAEAIGDAA